MLRPPRQIRVATYNVQKGFGMDLRRDPRRTVQVIAGIGADVLALQEADRRFGYRAGVFDLEHVIEETGLHPLPVPLRLGERAHGWHGNLLFCRAAEVQEVRPLHLPGAEPRGALLADVILPAIGPTRLIAAHLAIQPSARRRQAEVLADLVPDTGRPVILMGDLNEWRRKTGHSLTALDNALGLPALAPSYPAPFPRAALDRIYVSASLRVLAVSAHDTPLARRASDHLPVYADLQLQQPVDR